jgi:hypothetical protein
LADGIFRLGCGSGFSGDRLDAPGPVVDALIAAGDPAAIMFETLGERTLALAQLARDADPEAGYEPDLEPLLEPILARCVRAGIPIIGNFGAANPTAAARLIAAMARRQGLGIVKIGVVAGDDVRDRLDSPSLRMWEADAGSSLDGRDVIAANAYLGAAPIAEALARGCQVVVTGRVTDSALALGPLIHHFGWRQDDWNRMAAGVVIGHLLECGAQVTGGYFGDPGFKDVPDPATIGYPIAEVSEDGSAVITKPDGTGGVVSTLTVKEQLLYEIHDPAAYLTPDVTLDMTGLRVTPAGPDRVQVTGARGTPPPPDYKVTVSYRGGWLGEGEISYAGPNALARARAGAATVIERIRHFGLDCAWRTEIIGQASVFESDAGGLAPPDAARPDGDYRLRLAVNAADRETAARAAREVLSLYCAGPAAGGGVRHRVTPRLATVSCLVPQAEVRATVEVMTSDG